MKEILVIGVGAGDPDYITVQAIRALNRVDVFFVVDKGAAKDDLVQLRREVCERHITGDGYRFVEVADPERDRSADGPAYAEAVRVWHERRAELFEELIATELGEDGVGAFLVWGDPSLYDGTLRIIDGLLERGRVRFEYTVVPGISALHSLTARHRIPLNRIGEPIRITTGRRLAATGMPPGEDNVVVMLDGECAFRTVTDESVTIYWGAYLGTPDELLISGPVTETGPRIEEVRAKARARKGWIMDTYLLRRTPVTTS